jgi:hypothetical protein
MPVFALFLIFWNKKTGERNQKHLFSLWHLFLIENESLFRTLNNYSMEKYQHNSGSRQPDQQQENVPANAPGQQVPDHGNNADKTTASEKEEQHSESSLPQHDNETLGTP